MEFVDSKILLREVRGCLKKGKTRDDLETKTLCRQ